jgi:dihydroorotate dehydrogenase
MDRSTECLRSFSVILSGRLDLVGVGGISNARDVVRKLSAGANAVQLYSALVFEGPGLVSRIKSDLVRLMEAEGVDTLAALSGA